MVRGRLIPTSYFRDPDVMSLSSGDVRLILVGLVLHADDYGRGLAHAVILGRDLDYPPGTIEAALVELEQAELFSATRWANIATTRSRAGMTGKSSPSARPPAFPRRPHRRASVQAARIFQDFPRNV